MTDAKDLVGITMSGPEFGGSAKHCFPSQTLRALDARVTALNEIADRIGAIASDMPLNTGIELVFRKFKSFVASTQQLEFKKREIRALAYALDYSEAGQKPIISTKHELEKALQLITEQWNHGYLTGLLGCYLKNWGCGPKESLLILHQTVYSRLQNYSGNRPAFLLLKSCYRFFEPSNGDFVFGAELAIRRASIATAVKEIALPASWMTYPYFHGVILSFYEKSRNRISEILPDLEKALNLHTSGVKGSWTALLLTSRLIIQVKYAGEEAIQERVKLLAFSLLGDPANPKDKEHWAARSDATPSEKKDIEVGRQILSEWITRQFITVFFETCLDDPRRKSFWLSMANRVSEFKVFGSKTVRTALLRDKRIKDFVDGRYQVCGGSNNVAAILMHVKDYALVEFSDTGWAFYAYRIGSKFCPRKDEYYHSIGELRNTGLPKLLRREGRQIYALADEGSLSHMDGDMRWEEVFRYWIKQKVGDS